MKFKKITSLVLSSLLLCEGYLCSATFDKDMHLNTKKTQSDESKVTYQENDLCWLYSSILFYYYEPNFHDVIVNFPIEEVQTLLNRSFDLSSKDKNSLIAFIELSKIFKNIDLCTSSVYTFECSGAQNLLKRTRNVISFSPNLKCGNVCEQFIISLYTEVFESSIQCLKSRSISPEWCSSTQRLGLGEPHPILPLDLWKRAGVSLRRSENHFWVRVRGKNDKFYDIGKTIPGTNTTNEVQPNDSSECIFPFDFSETAREDKQTAIETDKVKEDTDNPNVEAGQPESEADEQPEKSAQKAPDQQTEKAIQNVSEQDAEKTDKKVTSESTHEDNQPKEEYAQPKKKSHWYNPFSWKIWG